MFFLEVKMIDELADFVLINKSPNFLPEDDGRLNRSTKKSSKKKQKLTTFGDFNCLEIAWTIFSIVREEYNNEFVCIPAAKDAFFDQELHDMTGCTVFH